MGEGVCVGISCCCFGMEQWAGWSGFYSPFLFGLWGVFWLPDAMMAVGMDHAIARCCTGTRHTFVYCEKLIGQVVGEVLILRGDVTRIERLVLWDWDELSEWFKCNPSNMLKN